MLDALRHRLFASYLLLMVITLGVVALAFVLILNTRPAPPEPTYQRLAQVALNINLADIIASDAPPHSVGAGSTTISTLIEHLTTIAQEQGVRLLLVNIESQNIFYDSQFAFADNTRLNGRIEPYIIPAQIRRGTYGGQQYRVINAIRGQFANPDKSSEWLFVGLEMLQQNDQLIALLFAEPRPQQTLQDVLADFGTEMLPILLQAGSVSLVLAIILAGMISRSVAKPLQNVAIAVRSVADGNYDDRVPISGPQEVKAVAESFNVMSEKVRDEQRVQQDFLVNVSHDLKTPLTSIQGFSQAIIDGVASPAEAAAIIYDEAARLNRMVLELTDLARLEAGRLSMKLNPIDMGQLSAAVCQRLNVVAKEKGIALTVDATPMPSIMGDGDRLAQVLTNLISNAIQHTHEDGSILVRTYVNNGGVEVSVQDSGVGIPHDEQARIFERFYQIDKSRGPKRGTGLGLAIVSEIVQAHGGKIEVFSEGEGKGARFTLWLPLAHLTPIRRK